MNKTDYTKLRDAYYGTGGYADGSYLIQHPRESAKKYKQRQMLSYYLNYVAATVNSHVDPIYRQPIRRDCSGAGSNLFEAFLQDVDSNGTSMQDFAKRCALSAKLYGTVIVVMDNATTQPPTEADVITQRAYPYCYTVDPSLITGVEADRFGRLTTLAYREIMPPEEAAKAVAAHRKPYYLRIWTRTDWTLMDENSNKVIDQGEHNLGAVPAVMWHSRNMDSSVLLQPSEFAAIQQTNDQIYQVSSWLTEIMANQTFSILIMPKSGTEDPGTLTLGTDNAIAFPAESSKAPDFIAPPSDPATVLQSQIDRMIKEIYRMASLSYATGTKQSSSGIAKQWDFESQNTALSNFAHQCESAEKALAALFALWTHKPVEYNVTYPSDYNLIDTDAELDKALKAITLDDNIEYRKEVMAKVLDAYMPNLLATDKERIINSMTVPAADTLTAPNNDDESQAE